MTVQQIHCSSWAGKAIMLDIVSRKGYIYIKEVHAAGLNDKQREGEAIAGGGCQAESRRGAVLSKRNSSGSFSGS